jgi:excisionase family DNA binding protein
VFTDNCSKDGVAGLPALYQLTLELLEKVVRLERRLESGSSQSVPEQILFTTRSAAAFVDVSAKTLERKIRAGELPAHRLKGRGKYYIRRDDLLKQFEPTENVH